LSANSPDRGSSLLRLYIDIAVWRRGPQDLPTAPLLLPLSVLAYFMVYIASEWLARRIVRGDVSNGLSVVTLALDVLYVAGWYWLLLRLFRRSERYGQTTAAIFGCTALLTLPLALAAQLLIASSNGGIAWLAPLMLCAIAALVVWSVLILAHILRHALERPLALCVILVIAQLVSEQLLVSALP